MEFITASCNLIIIIISFHISTEYILQFIIPLYGAVKLLNLPISAEIVGIGHEFMIYAELWVAEAN